MDEFHGVPLIELRIKSIDWRHRAEYIRTRASRKARPREFDVEPGGATEAAKDPRALVGLGGGDSIRVVGWSQEAQRVLTVILVPKDLDDGTWWGANAWAANRTEERRYRSKED